MSIFGDEWDDGEEIAKFKGATCGPEESWEVVMKRCLCADVPYRVVKCPDSGRLMWFEDDRTGRIEANRVFCDFVEISMCDSVAEKEKN